MTDEFMIFARLEAQFGREGMTRAAGRPFGGGPKLKHPNVKVYNLSVLFF